MASARTPIVGGNWKMHLDRAGARDLLVRLAGIAQASAAPPSAA